MHKHLTVEYEIVGTGGSLHSYEMDGRLLETLHASALPVVAPQVVILAATYGYTAELIAERKRVLTKELYELQAIRHRRVCGLTVSREQNKRLRKMPELQQRLKRLGAVVDHERLQRPVVLLRDLAQREQRVLRPVARQHRHRRERRPRLLLRA